MTGCPRLWTNALSETPTNCSTYKPDVIDSINYLAKSGLLNKSKPSRRSIKMILKLTESGRNTANLILSVKKYIESWSKLGDTTEQTFLFDYPLAEMMRIQSFQTFNTGSYDNTTTGGLEVVGSLHELTTRFKHKLQPSTGLSYLVHQSPQLVINIIVYKYLLLLRLNQNELAKFIIQKIVIDLLTEVLTHMNIPEVSVTDNENDKISDAATGQALGLLDIVSLSGGFAYRFMNKEVIDVLDSIFSIVQPRKDFIESHWDSIRWRTSKESGNKFKNYKENYADEGLLLLDKILKLN
jgi:hypothetical protein